MADPAHPTSQSPHDKGGGGAEVRAVAPATAHYTALPHRFPEATVDQAAAWSTVASGNLCGKAV